jgi:LPS-assembly lipoprotein
MSSPVRIIGCVLLLSLAACGFQPMYGEQNQQALSAGVQIAASKDAMGQQFQQNLEDRLNPGGMPAKPAYRLSVTVGSVTSGMGVARDGTVSRFNVTLRSGYVLLRLSDNVEIQRGEIQHVSSFNNQANQYFSTYISEKDAISRGITELSELYRQRIGALLLKDSAP